MILGADLAQSVQVAAELGGLLFAVIVAFAATRAYGKSSTAAALITQLQSTVTAYKDENGLQQQQLASHERKILEQGQTIIDQAHDLVLLRSMVESRDAVESLAGQTAEFRMEMNNTLQETNKLLGRILDSKGTV